MQPNGRKPTLNKLLAEHNRVRGERIRQQIADERARREAQQAAGTVVAGGSNDEEHHDSDESSLFGQEEQEPPVAAAAASEAARPLSNEAGGMQPANQEAADAAELTGTQTRAQQQQGGESPLLEPAGAVSPPGAGRTKDAIGAEGLKGLGRIGKRQKASEEAGGSAPPRKKTRRPEAPANQEPVFERTRTTERPGGTSQELSWNQLNERKQRGESTLVARRQLQNVRLFLKRCREEPSESNILKLRDALHGIVFQPTISNRSLKETKFLETLREMTVSSDLGIILPPYIREDAQALLNRWANGDLIEHLMRGLKTHVNDIKAKSKAQDAIKAKSKPQNDNTESTDQTPQAISKALSMSVDQDWKFRKTSEMKGHNGLVNGDWVPYRMNMVANGAHGAAQAGIAGNEESGARSIVVSGGSYDNQDNGDELWYFGTKASRKDIKESSNTKMMLRAHAKRNPIRVFRSAGNRSRYAPAEGIRYDGLYIIVGAQLVDPESHHYRFHLRRIPIRGQTSNLSQADLTVFGDIRFVYHNTGPLRFEGDGIRPTRNELDAFSDLKDQRKKSTAAATQDKTDKTAKTAKDDDGSSKKSQEKGAKKDDNGSKEVPKQKGSGDGNKPKEGRDDKQGKGGPKKGDKKDDDKSASKKRKE